MADMCLTTAAHECRGGLVELTLTGELSARTAERVRRTVDKLLLDRGRLMVDVTGLRVDRPEATLVFPTSLAAAAGGWPAARLVLLDEGVTRPSVWSAIRRWLPIASRREEVDELIRVRPELVRRRYRLPVAWHAPALARSLVRDTCADWDLPGLTPVAEVVSSELVDNALNHARTSCTLSLTLSPRGVRVEVRDKQPGDPADVATPPGGRAFGLVLVDEFSRSWGVVPHPDGKTVWALLVPN